MHDTNIPYANKNLKSLEATVNSELKKLHLWLVSNKLTLNTTPHPPPPKIVIFHPYQKSVDYLPQLKIFDTDTSRYVSLETKNYVLNQERIKGTEKASPIHTLFHR